MVVIRLTRRGAKKRPFYHVVAADKSKARDGRFIEQLGFYAPLAKNKDPKNYLSLSLERIDYWRKNGAQPSPRVQYLLDEFAKLPAAAALPQQSSATAAATDDAKSGE